MNGIVFLGVIAGFLFIVFLLGLRNAKEEEKSFCNECKNEYGKSPQKRYLTEKKGIDGYFKNHESKFPIDDITWNDLAMDEVLDRINYCETSSGEEYLYFMLRNPLDEAEGDYIKMEEELDALAADENERIRLKSVLHKIGKTRNYSIYDYLGLLGDGRTGSNLIHYSVLALMVIAVILMTTWNFTAGFIFFLVLVAYNIVSYFRTKAEIEPHLVTFAYVTRLISMAGKLTAVKSEVFSDEKRELTEITGRLSDYLKGSWIVTPATKSTGSGNPFEVLLDYIRMLTHIDLIKFNKMFAGLKNEKDSVDRLITIMGRIDALLSICYYRASLDGKFCKPEFTGGGESITGEAETASVGANAIIGAADNVTIGADSGNSIVIKDGYHPLIESPVVNSVETGRGILITGSNASGKSTFLKMCALNALLAQSIHTCPAAEYKAPKFRIFSSMALRDDLNYGDSYYMVEIKSLKRIIDASKDETAVPVLCFIDEVLRGTNTVERIAASTKVLEYFADSKVFCFAATHDGELATLLAEKYDICHFEGVMQGDDVIFDYTVKPGATTIRNAIKLLGTIGYDTKLVQDAEAMAENFDAKGIWELV